MVRFLALTAGVVVAAVIALAAFQAWSPPVDELNRRVPERTALMKRREAEAKREGRSFRPQLRWVPYTRISPLLRRAILIAEDDAFFMHGGLDWNEIQAAAKTNLEKRRVVRGGSTITQQLAKNLYLGDQRTPTRKLAEVFLAYRLERALTKRRIFELYLNLIEWGDGVYGAEAAARRYFEVSAAELNERQAVLLAAVIINPRRYSPLRPPRHIERRVRTIASRMRRRGFLDQNQYLAAIGSAPAASPPGTSFWIFGRPIVGPIEPETTAAPPEPPADTATADSL
jgi:monofunctional biosynthetic peptidoglycan transglycosylase